MPSTLDLTPGMPEVLLPMAPAMHLTGTVVDADGNPATLVYVSIAGGTIDDNRYAQRTNEQGEFDLYIPANLVAPKNLCKLVVLPNTNEQPPHPLASSDEFPLTIGGEKNFTLKLTEGTSH